MTTPEETSRSATDEAKPPTPEERKHFEDVGKWLFTIVGVMGALGVVFSPAGLDNLHGDTARSLFMTSLAALSLSLVVSLVGIAIGLRRRDDVPVRRMFALVGTFVALALLIGLPFAVAKKLESLPLEVGVGCAIVALVGALLFWKGRLTGTAAIAGAGLLFAAAIGLGGGATFASALRETKWQHQHKGLPYISYSLDGNGDLRVVFDVFGLPRGVSVTAALQGTGPDADRALPRGRSFTDTDGAASIELFLPDANHFHGLSVIAHWKSDDEDGNPTICTRVKSIKTNAVVERGDIPVVCRPYRSPEEI